MGVRVAPELTEAVVLRLSRAMFPVSVPAAGRGLLPEGEAWIGQETTGIRNIHKFSFAVVRPRWFPVPGAVYRFGTAGEPNQLKRGTMADSFGDDVVSDEEGTQNSAQFISEPTGEPNGERGAKKAAIVFPAGRSCRC